MAALAVRTTPLLAGGALMLASLSLIFLWVPTDAVLGVSQRIFYFHVPLAWVGFLAFGVVFVASVAYLWRGGARWDALAFASAEIGMLFMTMLLVTGVLWAKASWGVWWTWSPQLTTSLILWLIYAGYLMLRAYGPVGGQGARYAAVVGIIGFFDVPIVYMAAKWWRDVHPEAVVGPLAEEGSLEGSMYLALMLSLVAFTALFGLLLAQRYRLRRHEEALEVLRQRYD